MSKVLQESSYVEQTTCSKEQNLIKESQRATRAENYNSQIYQHII